MQRGAGGRKRHTNQLARRGWRGQVGVKDA